MDEGVVIDQLVYSHQVHPRPHQQSVYLYQMSMCLHEIQHHPKIKGFNNEKSEKRRTPHGTFNWSPSGFKCLMVSTRRFKMKTPEVHLENYLIPSFNTFYLLSHVVISVPAGQPNSALIVCWLDYTLAEMALKCLWEDAAVEWRWSNWTCALLLPCWSVRPPCQTSWRGNQNEKAGLKSVLCTLNQCSGLI